MSIARLLLTFKREFLGRVTRRKSKHCLFTYHWHCNNTKCVENHFKKPTCIL